MTSDSRAFLLLSQVYIGAVYVTAGTIVLTYLFVTENMPDTFSLVLSLVYAVCLIVAMGKWLAFQRTDRTSNYGNLASVFLWLLPIGVLLFRMRVIGADRSHAFAEYSGGTAHLVVWLGATLICSILLLVGDWRANKRGILKKGSAAVLS